MRKGWIISFEVDKNKDATIIISALKMTQVDARIIVADNIYIQTPGNITFMQEIP